MQATMKDNETLAFKVIDQPVETVRDGRSWGVEGDLFCFVTICPHSGKRRDYLYPMSRIEFIILEEDTRA